MSGKVFSLDSKRQQKMESDVYSRWEKFYLDQNHEDLLEALVYEHEHDFPLRRSSEIMDQLRHKALVNVLTHRAQTEFLRGFLEEIKAQNHN
jgi:hypothetical protein